MKIDFEFPVWVRPVAFIMGSIIIALGLFLNSQLMSGMSVNISEQIGLGAVGISLDMTKVIFFTVGILLVSSGFFVLQVVGFVFLVMYVPLAAISLNATWGYGLVIAQEYEERALKKQNIMIAKSDAVIAQKAVLANVVGDYQRLSSLYGSAESAAQAKLDGNSLAIALMKYKGLPVGVNSNGNSAGTVGSKITSCPGDSYYHTKYPQHCQKITTLKKQIAEKLAFVQGHAKFLNLKGERATETSRLGELTAVGVGAISSVFHPLYRALADQYKTTVLKSKNNMTFGIALSVEISGLFLFALGLLAKQTAKSRTLASTITWEELVAYEQHRGTILEHFSAQAAVIENKSSSRKAVTFSTKKSENNPTKKVPLPAAKSADDNDKDIEQLGNDHTKKVTLPKDTPPNGGGRPDVDALFKTSLPGQSDIPKETNIPAKKKFFSLANLKNSGKRFLQSVSP